MKLILSEVFGPTIQGEGPTAGHRCAFVRLGLCNLRCAWCDTPYTWDWTGMNGTAYDKASLDRIDVEDVVALLEPMHVERVVISGGEPLVQAQSHARLVTDLRAARYEVETETNGTLLPHQTMHFMADEVRWNVSPKLHHAGNGMSYDERIRPDVLRWFAERPMSSFKFVIDSLSDIDEVCGLADICGIAASQVWLMPKGITVDELTDRTATVFDAAVQYGFNACSRAHVLAWGNERGK
jgi:organic radical activating enzyme